MVQIDAKYEGNLRCKAMHVPSNATVLTDAPKDNMGKGESFSPTDLVATALGTCMLTTMAIAAKKHDIPFEGASLKVLKDMTAEPPRRIKKLTIEIIGPGGLAEDKRLLLEKAAVECPVSRSLHPDVQTGIVFNWKP